MKHMHQISRWGSYGLVVVFIGLTIFLISATTLNMHVTDLANESVHMNDLYQQTHYLVSSESALLNDYYLEPSGETLAAEYVAMQDLVHTLQTIRHDGDIGDRAFVERVLPEQEQYRVSVQKLFAAIEKRQTARAKTLHDHELDKVFDLLNQQTAVAAQEDRQLTTQNLANLRYIQHLVEVIVIIVFTICLFLFVLFWRQVRAYENKLDEVTEAKIEEVTHAALTDSLTYLGNHRSYQEGSRLAMERATQYNELLALALINVDEFKLINDTYGHSYADHFLRRLSMLMCGLPVEVMAYRLAGDEFALLLPRLSLDEATEAMKNLCELVPQHLSGATISIGVAVSSAEVNEIGILQEQAEVALYEAKRSGRHRVATYEDIQENTSFISSAKARALQRLLVEGEVKIAFQPIWHIRGGPPLAFEALTRPAATYGFSGPQEAFDVADRLGHAPELDRVCVRAILARAHELPPQVLLFVNLSPQTLESDLFNSSRLVQAVTDAGLVPERVVLEITERSMLRPEIIVREAKRLRALGFGLALDDTGAGNAGLEMLSQLPVDFVKIDRSVMVRALSEQSARAVLAGITAIAHETSALVIAEGIENIEMFDLACAMHAQAVQGYLLGRPSEVIPDAAELQRLSPVAQIA